MAERVCEFEGCGRKHYGKGYCNTHWQQLRKGNELTEIKKSPDKSLPCKFDGCARKSFCRAYCHSHYNQLRRGVELEPVAEYRERVPEDMTLEERLWGRVDKTGPDGCWLWVGGVNEDGYGRFTYNGKSFLPHRLSYELEVGPIPDGMQIDHLCHAPACVRPDHLRVVDISANAHNRTSRVSESGFRGVYKSRGKWYARIMHQRERHRLGSFDTAEQANEAAIAYRKKHGIIIDSRTELLGLDPVKV